MLLKISLQKNKNKNKNKNAMNINNPIQFYYCITILF